MSGTSVQASPDGKTVEDRVTGSENPSILLTETVESPEEPLSKVIVVGLADMEKSVT